MIHHKKPALDDMAHGVSRDGAGFGPNAATTVTTAVLGPTNTGKTHRAVERMLEHASGMLGLPLRLLAREVYDKVTTRVGERAVALVTGEEKRIPPHPRYWICTVESMPVELGVDFLAVDEVQLAAHPQRGHVFTDRLLNARGRLETWFLGADRMRPLIEQLVPTARIQRHPRLSKLSYAGALGLSALPPRSAVIAFSAAEVYELAEKLRRRRGGAAVVLGALSPRTRNAQVAMYQAGEVDFMVATDAVGMGLNMDVDHVAFASLRKFDGARIRQLTAPELAQIAGRAGRYTRNGSFGTLNNVELPDDVVFAIESHRFSPLQRVYWRNSDLDLSSVASLLDSLAVRPRRKVLQMADTASDEAVLRVLAERPSVARLADEPDRVRLLWEVCRVPDFRKLLVEHHASFLEAIFLQLSGPKQQIDPDFMHERIARLEADGGDIDDLLMRMEFIRTWNYIAHSTGWVADADSWQARTRTAEDRLSQALHERLMSRFVDDGGRKKHRRGGGKSRPRRARSSRAEAAVERAPSGPFAKLAEMRDALAASEAPADLRDDWVEAVVDAEHLRFQVDGRGAIRYVPVPGSDVHEAVALGRLTRGRDLLHPEIKLALPRTVGAGAGSRILRRLRAWARDLVDDTLGPLRHPEVEQLSAAARGLVYQLAQSLGTIEVRSARPQLRELSDADRGRLAELDVVIGRRHVYVSSLLEPDRVAQRMALSTAYRGESFRFAPPSEGTATLVAAGHDGDVLRAIGYPACGPLAIRADLLERLEQRVASLVGAAPFKPPAELSAWLGSSEDDLRGAIVALGYTETADGFVPRRRRSRRGRRR